jgi:CubicO group peptidase (beta-lactamase class C family)
MDCDKRIQGTPSRSPGVMLRLRDRGCVAGTASRTGSSQTHLLSGRLLIKGKEVLREAFRLDEQTLRPAEQPLSGFGQADLPITGLLIAKDDQILFEDYQYGRTDRDRFTSQSMAKTIVGMLTGVAVSEHALASVADTTQKYVPELKDYEYGKITIRDLLHMSSGMSCDSPNSALETIGLQTLIHNCKQRAPAGTRFQYSPADSELLGLILTHAVQMPLALYLEEKIWSRIGAEAKATWTIDASDHELPYCCFNAVLRDYARFARLLAFDGAWNGKQLIPGQWLLDATTVNESDAQLAPGKSTRFFGYGYQVWIFPGARRMFGLLGANGQRIFVDPQSKLILVQTAVMERAMDPGVDAEMIALWMGLVRRFGD